MDATRKAIIDAASDWFVRARERDLSHAERREFAGWLLESPVHVIEYLAVARLWGDVAQVDELGAAVSELSEANVEGNVIELAVRAKIREYAPDAERKRRRVLSRYRLGRRAAALGGSVLAFVLLSVSGWWIANNTADRHVTIRGEQRSLALDDGTVIEMNTSSEIRVEYDSAGRYVTLVQGEVFFDVQEDAARPFIVRAGGSEIRVLGTKFNVYMQARETTVTVLEGNVTVSTSSVLVDGADSTGARTEPSLSTRPNGERVSLVGGESAVIDNETHRITTAALANPEQVVVWTDRRVVFDESRLDQILAEFARYNDFDYVISSNDVATLEFTGIFDTQDLESFISYLEFNADVSISRSNGQLIVASPP